MMNRYYIIDDFYNNSDELVKFALDSVKEGGMKGNFAGVMTPTSFLAESLREMFQKLLLETSIDSSANACGRIRFSKEMILSSCTFILILRSRQYGLELYIFQRTIPT